MSEELQNDDDLQGDEVVIDEPIEAAVLDADTGDNQENKQDSEGVDKAQAAINKKHFQFKEAERNTVAEKERADRAEQELRELRNEREAPGNVPDMPDPYEDDFDAKMLRRDSAIRDKAIHDSNVRNEQDRDANSQLAAQQEVQKAANERFTTYQTRAADFGMTPETVSAISAVGNSLDQALQNELMSDPDGPLIIQHLFNNTGDIDTLNGMSLIQVGSYIDQHIRPKTAALKPKISGTPDPAKQLNGDGVDLEAGKNPYSQGATFD